MFASSVFRTEFSRKTTLMSTSLSIVVVIDDDVEEEEYRVRPPSTMILPPSLPTTESEGKALIPVRPRLSAAVAASPSSRRD